MKTGLDDYLCNHSIEDIKKLPVHEIFGFKEALDRATPEITSEALKELERQIAMVKSASEMDRYINTLRDKTGISKRAIIKDVKQFSKFAEMEKRKSGESEKYENIFAFNNTQDEEEKITTAYFPGLVDLVMDDSENVAYLIKTEGSLEIVTERDVGGTMCFPPRKQHLPFKLASANNVIIQYEFDTNEKLFEGVLSYLKRFSYLPDEQWLIVACNVYLSYLQDHPDIHYLPMLLFFAVPERGKSRTGKAVSYVSFRGIHVVDLREANLFRHSGNLKATIFFDLMDLWKKAERNGAEDILLLRYEKGAKVMRVIYPEKGAFEDTVYYEIYGSTIIATNEPVHKILGSRCINIDMQNKPGNYENPTPEKAQEIKERLTAWRARVMNKSLPEIDIIQGLNGRLWDISRPLLQVCKLVYPQGFDGLEGALLEVAGARVEDKRESIEGQIITVLYELSLKSLFEGKIKTSELLDAINRGRPENHKLTSQYVGRKLKAMGLHTRRIHGLSEILLNRSGFDVLLDQYGICENIRPNSTNSTCPTESSNSTGRELVESREHSTNIRPAETLENSGQVGLVESGRELGGSLEENNTEEIPEVEYVEMVSNV